MRTIGRLLVVVSCMAFASGCGWVVRASVDNGGGQSNGHSYQTAVNADGRFVAFESDATNLVPGDTNGVPDLFVRDNRTGQIERIGTGATLGDISEDGRYVAYVGIAPCGGASSISALFIRDRQLGLSECVAAGVDPNSAVFSATARFVAFNTPSTGPLVLDRTTGQFDQIPVPVGHFLATDLALSDDGRFLAFTALRSSGDIGGADVYVRDRQNGTSQQLPLPTGVTDGFLANPSISADGRWVAFELWQNSETGPTPTYFRSVWSYDRLAGTSEAVSVKLDGSVGHAYSPDISDDGRFIALIGLDPLTTGAPAGFGAMYVRDRVEDRTTLVSRSAAGASQGASRDLSIADDGRYVSFTSGAANLVTNDTNDKLDVFVAAIPQVFVQSVSPNLATRGATVELTVTGDGFRPTPIVAVPGDGVSVTAVTYVSEHELTISVTVDTMAPTGARTVAVTNTGTGPGPATGTTGLCGSCLTIS